MKPPVKYDAFNVQQHELVETLNSWCRLGWELHSVIPIHHHNDDWYKVIVFIRSDVQPLTDK
jgi:hypothetical protein